MGPRLFFSALLLSMTVVHPAGQSSPPASVVKAPEVVTSQPKATQPSIRAPFAYSNLVLRISNKYGMEWQFVTAIMEAESNFNPRAISEKGAVGLMQLLPSTGARYQLDLNELYNPRKNLEAGIRHLRNLNDRYQGNKELIIAAYNTGEAVIDRYHKVPPYKATQSFVKKVLSRYYSYLNLSL